MPNKLQLIAFRWFENFNDKDLEKLLSLYDDDAEHYSPKLKIHQPETNGLIKGKEAIRNWWGEVFLKYPSLNYKVTSFTANDDRIFMEYIRQADNEDDLVVAEVLEVRNDKIISSRVYHG